MREKLAANASAAAKTKAGAGNKPESRSGRDKGRIDPIEITNAQVNLVAQTVIGLSDKNTAQQLLKLLDALENQDDVQQVYANFDMDNAWLEELSG